MMPRLALRAGLVALAALPLSAVPRALQEPPRNGDSYTLLQGLRASGRIQFHVPDGACTLAAQRLADVLTAAGELEVSVDPAEHDVRAVRVMVGAPLDPGFEPLARACGIEVYEGGGFRVLERDYLAPGDAAVAVFEDPLRNGRPLCLVLGNDKDLLARYLDELPRLSRPYLWVHADGELALECPLGPAGRPKAGEARDYLAARTEYFADAPQMKLENLVVHARHAPDAARWRAYLTALSLARKRVLAWLGASEAPAVEVFLYEHAEDLERCLGASELAVPNRLHPRVHALLASDVPDDGGATLARVLARELAGPPSTPWVEDGLATAASGRLWQTPLDDWITHLGLAGLLPGPDDVQDPLACGRLDPFVLAPARAFLFRQTALGAGRDANAVRALWKGAPIGDKRIALAYQKGLLGLTKGARRGGPRAARRQRAAQYSEAPFRHGLALVQSAGARYSARAADEALEAAGAFEPGPDAISLTVWAAAETPLPPTCTLAPRTVHGTASDLALASACGAARARKQSVLLALEVLASPNGSWADNISWTAPDAVPAFFLRYQRVALHYALLAELLHVDAFSFGANLREAVRTEPRKEVREPEIFEQRRAGWKVLIALLHRAYGGALTYSARFPAEGTETGFFEDLDFIGVSLFPRLAPEPAAPDEDELRRALRFALQQALDLGVRWNKPIVLTQVGFPARAESWMEPYFPSGAADVAAQRSYLAALADVLASGRLDNAAILRGYFLWNWPLAEGEDAAFSLRRGELGSALRRLFAR